MKTSLSLVFVVACIQNIVGYVVACQTFRHIMQDSLNGIHVHRFVSTSSVYWAV